MKKDFSLQGFETRGTDIALRLTTWSNLLDFVSHLGPLTTNPMEGRALYSTARDGGGKSKSGNKRRRRRKKKRKVRRTIQADIKAGKLYSMMGLEYTGIDETVHTV